MLVLNAALSVASRGRQVLAGFLHVLGERVRGVRIRNHPSQWPVLQPEAVELKIMLQDILLRGHDCVPAYSEVLDHPRLGNCSPSVMLHFSSKDVCQLLHNKFVVILGDSIQRSVYKDLVRLMQNDCLLTSSQMKAKGDLRFENDHLVEGGVLSGLHSGTHYREVRQYRTSHHLVRFYFLTRVYSPYLESILEDFRTGPQPDVLILNSCVWDISRYGPSSMKEYRANLETAFNRLDAALPSSCLVIWNMTMPLGPKVTGGFLTPELQHLSRTLRNDVIEGNFYGATLAGFHLFDVVDLHYHFRLDLRNRVKDGIHWNNVVHRRITNLLLGHVADAWGVVIPDKTRQSGPVWDNRPAMPLDHQGVLPWSWPPAHLQGFPDHDLHRPDPDSPVVHNDSFLVLSSWNSTEPFSGFTSFEDSHFPQFDLDAVAFNDFHCWETAGLSLSPLYPSHNKESLLPRSSCWHRRPHLDIRHHHGFVRHQKTFHRRSDAPYRRDRKFAYKHY